MRSDICRNRSPAESRVAGRTVISHEPIYRFVYHRSDDHPLHRKATMTAQRLERRLRDLPQDLRRTISFDNGTELAGHHRLHALGLQTFFCDVRGSWQKGGVENTIGRLRRFLPRKTNLASLKPAHLRDYAQRLDHTPRNCLDFLTPAEAFERISNTALQT